MAMAIASRPANPKLELAGRAVTVGAHVLGEKLTRPVARNPGDVPVSGDRVTTQWLTHALCGAHPDAEVVGFTTPGGSKGTSTRTALRITYNAAGEAAGLPTQLFTKATTSFSQRLLLGGARVLHGETHFFMGLRQRVEMEAPLGYYGAVDEASWRSIVILEDIAATKGAQFIAPTTPLTRAQVEDLVQNQARYHGALWESDAIAHLKTPADHFHNVSSFINMRGRCEVGLQRAADVVPGVLHGQADRLWKGTERCLQLATDALPRTLLHADCHVGQTYITADGRMGLTDWQAAMQGGWGYDFAYLVGSACEPEDRRAWERDLLALYLEALAAHGGDAPAFDDAWLTYRQQLFYPLSAWLFTIGRAATQPKMQPDDISRAIIRRLTNAIVDLDSFAALGI